jgi:hypothetical protein
MVCHCTQYQGFFRPDQFRILRSFGQALVCMCSVGVCLADTDGGGRWIRPIAQPLVVNSDTASTVFIPLYCSVNTPQYNWREIRRLRKTSLYQAELFSDLVDTHIPYALEGTSRSCLDLELVHISSVRDSVRTRDETNQGARDKWGGKRRETRHAWAWHHPISAIVTFHGNLSPISEDADEQIAR